MEEEDGNSDLTSESSVKGQKDTIEGRLVVTANDNAKGQAPWLRAGNVAEFDLRVSAYGKEKVVNEHR